MKEDQLISIIRTEYRNYDSKKEDQNKLDLKKLISETNFNGFV